MDFLREVVGWRAVGEFGEEVGAVSPVAPNFTHGALVLSRCITASRLRWRSAAAMISYSKKLTHLLWGGRELCREVVQIVVSGEEGFFG